MPARLFQAKADSGGAEAIRAATALKSRIVSLWGTPEYAEAVAHGASSSRFQALIEPVLVGLGYQPEVATSVADTAYKPDFVFSTDSCSVMVEVERGKTLDNNMDMLDMWKCHIHPTARHLILLVPIWYEKDGNGDRPGSRTATYARVCRRMAPFFQPGCFTNVWSLNLLGY